MAVILGKKSVLRVASSSAGLAAASAIVTGLAEGTDSIGRSQSRDTREVPGGRGAMVYQHGKFQTEDFSLSCDSNSKHDAIFRTANGKKLHFMWSPEGEESGTPSYTGEFVATCSLTADINSDAVRWSVSAAVDGKSTEGTN